MFAVRTPTKESPGLQTSGITAVHDSLVKHTTLLENCEMLRLTTPIIQVARKLTRQASLTAEELGISRSLYIPRGPRDWVKAPLFQGQFDSEAGMPSALEWLDAEGILEELPTSPENVTRIDHILFSTYIRMQSLSVLWDLADGINKGSPHGSPKPWVIDELAILGFITVGEPVRDGSRGRPPIHLTPTSWGLQFVETTRKYGGVEITDAYRRAARRKGGSARPRLTPTDRLAAGYLANGQLVPDSIRRRISDYGKEELRRSYGVVFGEVD